VSATALAERARCMEGGAGNNPAGGIRRDARPDAEASREYVVWCAPGDRVELLDALVWFDDALLCVRKGCTMGSDRSPFGGKGNWKLPWAARLRSC